MAMQGIETAVKSDSPRMRSERTMRDWIENGNWAEGEQLPTEQALTESLGVSRQTVRAALKSLEKDGLIMNPGRQRSGRIVAFSRNQRGKGFMPSTIAVMTKEGGQIEREINEGLMGAIDAGIINTVEQKGLYSLLLSSRDFDSQMVTTLINERPRGLVINADVAKIKGFAKYVRQVVGAGIPVVINTADPEYAFANRVAFDHGTGARQLVKWMADKGCKRILRLWGDEFFWLKLRNQGYEKGVAAAGLESLPNVPVGNHVDDEADLATQARQYAGYLAEYLIGDQAVDALLTVTDCNASAIAEACQLLGRTPGKDIWIAGFDNYWVWLREIRHESCNIQVSVDKHNFEAGKMLVQVLEDEIAAPSPLEPKMTWIKPGLVEVPPRT